MFIKDIFFDWDSISEESYLKSIEAFRGLEQISFHKPVTFFVGENGSGKSTLLEAMAIAEGFKPEGGTKITSFPPMIRTRNSVMSSGCRGLAEQSGDIFCVPSVSTTWPRRKKSMEENQWSAR